MDVPQESRASIPADWDHVRYPLRTSSLSQTTTLEARVFPYFDHLRERAEVHRSECDAPRTGTMLVPSPSHWGNSWRQVSRLKRTSDSTAKRRGVLFEENNLPTRLEQPTFGLGPLGRVSRLLISNLLPPFSNSSTRHLHCSPSQWLQALWTKRKARESIYTIGASPTTAALFHTSSRQPTKLLLEVMLPPTGTNTTLSSESLTKQPQLWQCTSHLRRSSREKTASQDRFLHSSNGHHPLSHVRGGLQRVEKPTF